MATPKISEVLAAALELEKADRVLLRKALMADEAGLELDPNSVRRAGDEGLRALWSQRAPA